MHVRGEGPIPARIMVVGETPGESEERSGLPFQGVSGQELNRMLQEAGILRSDVYVTNVCRVRPPNNDIGAFVAMKKKDIGPRHSQLRDKWVTPEVLEGWKQLQVEIGLVQPNVIVACGNLAMWALTGVWGVTKWRGSLLTCDQGAKVIPTYHPAAILRQWSWRAVAVSDLKRAARHQHSRELVRRPKNYILRPSLEQVDSTIQSLLARLNAGETLWLDLDLETRAGHIACCGFSWSTTEAICIPFMCVESKEGYWGPDAEAAIIYQLYRLFTHPRVRIRWQNGLYDAQYIHRWWHFIPRGEQDTMISQHALFSDLPKSLAFQASMYDPEYVYWKDEGKTWAQDMSEEQLWSYNCDDCIETRIVGEAELATAEKLGLQAVHSFQQQMFWPVLQAMNRGLRVDEKRAADLAYEIQEQISAREQFIQDILGHPLNPRSPLQMQRLFYEDLRQPPIMSRAKKGQPAHVTCDDEALQKIGKREPLLQPLCHAIADIRTLGKFLKDFVLAKRDADGRMRCSFNIGGSESGESAPRTYRLSSSTNAFGNGANLQTIPSEKSKSVGKWMQRGALSIIGNAYELPNLRSMFVPDPGYTFFDMDLDRADIQVMAWDADEPILKEALRKKADIHLLNAYIIDGKEPPPFEELAESHPRYPDHRGPMKYKREFAKVFAHATDYLGKARTVSAAVGQTIAVVERAQRIYLGTYKGIKAWQDRIIAEVTKRRYVENRFGYRWYIFDRIDDSVMPEAVAWIPQSTVSVVINRIWMEIYKRAPEIQVLLQVHDSLAGQFPTRAAADCVARLTELSRVVVPYDDPLIIPTGISTSEVSWGDCK